MKIYYDGLIGSQLCGLATPTSDWDHFIIGYNDKWQSFDAATNSDCYYFNPEHVLHNWFHNIYQSPPSMNARHNVMNIFSTPVIDTEFSKWLLENRQRILDSNKPFFGTIMLMRTNLALQDPFKKSPKELVQAMTYLSWYIKYAENKVDFKECMQFSTEELQWFHDVQAMQVPFQDIVTTLQSSMDLAQSKFEFWNEKTDFYTVNKLRLEMADLLDVSGVKELGVI